MTKRYIYPATIVIASVACLFTACSDNGYQGPLPGGSPGGSGGNTTVGAGGNNPVAQTGGSSNQAGSATPGSAGSSAGSGGIVGSGGSAGAGGIVGSGGSVNSGGTAGSGGSAVVQPGAGSPIPLDMLQHKWRYTHACKYRGGQPISNFPTCSENNLDVCAELTNDDRWFDPNPPFWKFGGDPSKVYEIKLRLRGITEPKTYKNCKEVNVRADDGHHPMVCDGTGQNVANSDDSFNWLNFRLNDPRQDFYMNMAPIDEPHRVEKLDEAFTIRARGQSTATFLYDDLNGGEIRNCPKYTFPGITAVAPYDNTAIDGQFWQWDCEDPAGGDACWKVLP